MKEKAAQLYLIGTPLGNLQDVTLRAVETLKGLSVLFAEDTRELGKLLELVGVGAAGKTLHSCANHNLKDATEKALRYLREGKDLGFVSDRGMPGISDPGARLARLARAEGFGVVPVPGPSAPTTLLSVSGFEADRFVFLGFPPEKTGEREKLFSAVRALDVPICFFESPRRVRATLAELKARFPGGRVFVGREMTKLHETFTAEALAELDPESVPELGEFTIAVLPGPAEAAPEAWQQEAKLRLLSERDWAKALAARFGVAAKDIYNFLQQQKK